MATEVFLPRVDMDMASGKIARWYVEDGASIAQGDPLFEIETDKAAMEIEAPASGILRIEAATAQDIPVGAIVGWILAAGEEPPKKAAAEEVAQAEAVEVAAEPAPVSLPSSRAEPSNGEIRATPLARRLARSQGIDLATVTGSGPRGRIQAADIPDEAAAPALALAPVETDADAPVGKTVPARPRCAQPQPAANTYGEAVLHRTWLRRGEGDPLVLIHGFAADLGGWRPFVAANPTGRPVLAVDLPGHGLSPLLARNSVEDFAAAVAQTLAEEGVSRAHVVGHSLGSAVAATLADSGFDALSLLLLSPAGLGPDINGAFLDGLARARGEESLAPWLRLLVSDAEGLSPGFVRATAAARADGRLAGQQAAVAASLFPDGTQAFSIRPTLSRLQMPTRIVFGLDDAIIPSRHASGLPGSIALHFFAKVGHMPHIEIKTDVGRILAEQIRAD